MFAGSSIAESISLLTMKSVLNFCILMTFCSILNDKYKINLNENRDAINPIKINNLCHCYFSNYKQK